MREAKRRLLALELILAEVAPWLSEQALDAAATVISLRASKQPDDDQRVAHRYATDLLTRGVWRFSCGSTAETLEASPGIGRIHGP